MFQRKTTSEFVKDNPFSNNNPNLEKQASIGKSLITVGRFSYGYDTLIFKEWGEGASASIGNFCSIGLDVTIMLGGNHRVDWATTFPFGHIFVEELKGTGIVGHPSTKGDVIIGNDVWIGRGATILSGVEISDGAVIATNSTVTKDVGAYEIWGGNPAKCLKRRFSQEIIDALLTIQWWNFDVHVFPRVAPLLSQPPTISILEEVLKLQVSSISD